MSREEQALNPTVVGAIILDSLEAPTRVLAARRSRPAELAGRWEFPGGKVEPGEEPESALVREIHEELRLPIVVGAELRSPHGSWTISSELSLRLYFAEITAGEPITGESHDAVRWLTLDHLDDVAWLPADEQALPMVRRALGNL